MLGWDQLVGMHISCVLPAQDDDDESEEEEDKKES